MLSRGFFIGTKRTEGDEMADIEKVIEGLECCIKSSGKECIFKCPYFKGTEVKTCFVALATDALKYVKREEPIAPIKGEQGKCPICGYRVDHKYCPNCGQALCWD